MSEKDKGKFVLGIKETVQTFFKVNTLVSEIDPEFSKMAWRRAIASAAARLLPVSLFASFLQKIFERIIEDPTLLPIVLGILIILSTLRTVVMNYLDDSFWLRSEEFDRTLNRKIQDDLIAKTLSLDFARLSESRTAELQDEAGGEGYSSISKIWEVQFDMLSTVLSAIGAAVALLIADWKLTLCAAAPLIYLEVSRARFRKKTLDQWNESKKGEYKLRNEYQWCLRNREMSFQLRLFGVIQHFKTRFEQLRGGLMSGFAGVQQAIQSTNTNTSVLRSLCHCGVMLYLLKEIHHGKMPLAALILFSGQMTRLARSLGSLVRHFGESEESIKNHGKLRAYLELKPFLDEQHCFDLTLERVPKIRIESVMFLYPGASRPALENCTLSIEPGEVLAIVGHNGSGKTTLAKVLSKFYNPKEGALYIDETPLARVSQASWLSQMLYITAGNRVPEFPVDEVVAGVKREDLELDRMLEAARITGVHEFVKTLPSRYQTWIGDTVPEGKKFSEGEMQRLKLAGGIYQILGPGRFILLCDEPMANCDAGIREKFYSSLKQMSGKTIIVIAHDESYLHHFSRVIMMEKGRVVNDIRGNEAIEAFKPKLKELLQRKET